MKQYPSIEYVNHKYLGEDIWAFNKLDGSNIRCEWSKKRGWYKFGTRKQIIDQSHEQFGNAVKLFMDKYSEDLSKVFKDNKDYRNILSFVVFVEYFGDNSFAGYHVEEDDNKNVVLFDITMYKKGWVLPNNFINDFGHLDIPELIYKGKFTQEFISDVKTGKFNLKEGVVVKGIRKTKSKNDELIWMSKIKQQDWLDKIRNKFGEDALLKEVNNNIDNLK